MEFQNIYGYKSQGHEISEHIRYGYWVYLQNPMSGFLLFHAPSRGRCPLERKYNYIGTLGHIVSKHIYGYEVYLQNPKSDCLLFPAR